MIEKVVFVGDLVRTGDSQNRNSFVKNTNWLFRLLNKQISGAIGLRCEVLEWDENSKFNAAKIYELYGKKPSINAWAEIFDEENILPEVAEYCAPFFQNSLVIGFEVSPFLMRVFDALNVNCITLSWHPVRFMDDIFFGFETNDNKILEELKKFELPENAIYAHAEILRAHNYRKGFEIDFSGDLLIGQTSVDRALIHDCKIAQLADFWSKIKQHEKIYFKPHPFQNTKMNFEQVDAKYNIYDLLCSDKIGKIIALSSGVLTEAKYFEKDVLRLLPKAENSVPIYHEFLSQNFWADVLQPIFDTQKNNFQPIFKPNRLRFANCSNWGFVEGVAQNVVEDYE